MVTGVDEEGATLPSLRALDWTVTNYTKAIATVVTGADGVERDIHDAYNAELACYRRKNFDPFRRSNHVRMLDADVYKTKAKMVEALKDPDFDVNEHTVDTTVAQANFLMWAWKAGVLRFCRENRLAIEQHQETALCASRQRKKQAQKHRRSELSFSSAKRCRVYSAAKGTQQPSQPEQLEDSL